MSAARRSYMRLEPQDFTAFTAVDTDPATLTVTDCGIAVNDLDGDVDVYLYKDFGSAYFTGDYIFIFDFICNDPGDSRQYDGNIYLVTEQDQECLTTEGEGAYLITEGSTGIDYSTAGECAMCMLTNHVDDAFGIENGGYNHVRLDWTPGDVNGTYALRLIQMYDGVKYQASHPINPHQQYYIKLYKSTCANTLKCEVYADDLFNTRVFEISMTLYGDADYRYLFPFSSKNKNTACHLVTEALEDLLTEGSEYIELEGVARRFSPWCGIIANMGFVFRGVDLPVHVCNICNAVWIADDQMYEDPERCPNCGCYPRPLDGDSGEDALPWS